MTDDDKALVKRLRRTVCHGSLGCERLGVDDQAADRIEALSAENERLLTLLRDCDPESMSWLDARDEALGEQ
jgi:hypothetical protein